MALQRVWIFCGLVSAAAVCLALPASAQPGTPTLAAPRFTFKIDPKTPLKDLLPTPPEATRAGPILTDDPAKVHEVAFSTRPGKSTPDAKRPEQIAHQLAKISHVNAKKIDAFMTALLASRDDLAGLPFAMGDDCRTAGERTKQFTRAVGTVRQAMAMLTPTRLTGVNTTTTVMTPSGVENVATQVAGVNTTVTVMTPSGQRRFSSSGGAASFWAYFDALCEPEDTQRPNAEKADAITRGRIAALMQMLAPESPEVRLGLVKYLTAVPHVEVTKALARMAVFSAEDDIRLAAIESLKVRREKDYTDILLAGLRYPLPAVAKRSADAIIRLARTDLIPDLVAMLSADDPRLPAAKTEDGKPVALVREVVRVNHHRNCMMCHSPGNPETVSADAITAEVPVEGQPLPLPSQGYSQSSPDLMVRIDVTYLRQDFSAMLPVADAHPWPEMQRFDFLVRTRKLTSQEADDFKEKLTPREPGVLSPYHRAALAALRELTGKDTAPTADAWQKLLGLPAAKPRGQG